MSKSTDITKILLGDRTPNVDEIRTVALEYAKAWQQSALDKLLEQGETRKNSRNYLDSSLAVLKAAGDIAESAASNS